MTRDPELEQLRLDCLRLAVNARTVHDPVAAARDFYAFVTGQDAKTPRQLIDAALEAADVR